MFASVDDRSIATRAHTHIHTHTRTHTHSCGVDLFQWLSLIYLFVQATAENQALCEKHWFRVCAGNALQVCVCVGGWVCACGYVIVCSMY